MMKNKVQFQPGMSLVDFQQQFGNEEQCRNAVYQWRWPQGYTCPSCGNPSHCNLACRDLIQCHRCHHQTSLTAGTIFASTKLPLTTWFLAIYLLTQSKNGLSAMSLKRQLGVSYNTAWLMKQKIMQVMKEQEERQVLEGAIQVDDAYWGGQRHGGKRGRGAAGKTPFIAAIQCNEQGRPLRMKLTPLRGFNAKSIKAWAQRHLSESSQVISDGLAAFGALGEVCEHWYITTGGGAESMLIPEFQWVNTMLGNVKNAIYGTYHHISKKHIGRYLAAFSYRFNRRFDLSLMVDELAETLCHSPPLPYRLARVAEVHR